MMEIPKKIYEKMKLPFLYFAVNRGITANQITIFNHILTLTFGCWFFSRGTYVSGLLGLGVMIVNGFLDYLDGDLARASKSNSQLGEWLDSGFDVIIQNAVMGAIAIGCFKQGMSLNWIVLFFIGNTAMNFVSFHYNSKFGFHSLKGNQMFRDSIREKPTTFNFILRDIIDPTSNWVSLVAYTFRYWIAFGIITGTMKACFVAMVLICNFKWIVMYVIYAMYLNGDNHLHVINILKRLDDEQEEFFSIRNHE